jgi:transcriptional regulator with XRE-family HTH domain
MDYREYRRLLGERIRTIRKEKNIIQERLAELVDKTTEHISFIERGERSPSFELLIDLSQALDVSLPYLLNIVPLNSKEETRLPAPLPFASVAF